MSKSNIEWCDYSWNPIVGCRHDCPYCYARVFAKRFAGDVRQNINDDRCIKHENGLYEVKEPFINRKGRALAFPFGFNPTLMSYRLNDPKTWLTGRNIFVGSTADVFGAWVPDEWIESIFNACKEAPQHNYLFLTKNYLRYMELHKKGLLLNSENIWYGYSITKSTDWLCMANKVYKTFVSLEPLLDDVAIKLCKGNSKVADWVIIGAETGNRKGKVTPKVEWIEKIVAHCDKFNIPVFMKESLRDIVGDENMRQEYPPQLLHKEISEKNKKRLLASCSRCGKEMKKSDMYSVLAKKKRKESAILIGNVCTDCWPSFLEDLNYDSKTDIGTGESNGDKCSCSKKESQ